MLNLSKRGGLFPFVVVMVLAGAAIAPVRTSSVSAPAPVSIPFEPAARHVIVQVTVNGSRPLSFILDTGAHAAIIRTAVAQELNLKLEGTVGVGGAGGGSQRGSFV